MGLTVRRPRIKNSLVCIAWLLMLLCSQLFSPFESFAQIEEEDPEVNLSCMQIRLFDLSPNPTNPNIDWYASSPASPRPNTINICRATDFEITDDPSVPDGRCFVPVAEGGGPEMYVLYLMSSNQAATLPLTGTVVPQASGPWSTVLNAANIPVYNQNNFFQSSTGILTPFSINTVGQYAVIAAICTLNSNNRYEIISSTSGNPVSDKIYVNFLDTNHPLTISGEQYLCEGASNVYSIPSNLAGFNPVWTVNGGTFVSNGTSIQVNWSTPYTANSRVSVTLQLNEGGCELSASLNTFECCIHGHDSLYYIYNKSLSQTPFSGMSVVNPQNTPYRWILINGLFHVDANIHFQDMRIILGPQAKITLANNVELSMAGTPNSIAMNSTLTSGCGYMYDGIYVTHHSQKITFNNVFMADAINGIVSHNGGQIHVTNSLFDHYRVALQLINYNPAQVPTYSGSTSPLTLYGNEFRGGTNTTPFVGQHSETSIKVVNCGYVEIGKRNLVPNQFNPQTGRPNEKIGLAISMINSGGNIVNNQFFKINVIGSPSQTGAILATTSQHQPWIAPLQIGRLWTGGAAGDANHFDQGYQAIKTTNVRAVFIIDNTFKDYSSNITVINASDYRVIQGNKINFQLGSPSNPNRSASGIVVSSTHGLPTAGGAVWSNHVEACRQGIFLTTVNSMTISNNTIRTFSTAGASQLDARAGISASNGWNLIIRQNNLQHNTMAANSDLSGNNLRGISLNNVVDAFVWDNYVLRYGAGIHAANNNRVSQFRCNFLVGSIWGFNFDKVYLDQQGQAGDPTDNQWVSNRRAVRMNGSEDVNMPPTNWFYRNGAEFSPFALGGGLFQITPQLTSGGEVSCSNVVQPGDTIPVDDDKYEDPDMLGKVFGPVADSSTTFSSEAAQYFEKSITYRVLDEHTASMQQASANNAALANFYLSHYQSGTGEVKRLYDALQYRSTADAQQLMADFTPANVFEQKIAEVNTIYAQSWAIGRFELDSAEHAQLLPIALASALQWGEAVYTARVMLGMFDLDENVGASNQRRTLHEEIWPETDLGKAYPNPTQGSFSFAGSLSTGLEQGKLQMYDLQGRLVAEPLVLYNNGAWQVADPQLKSGMYLYRLNIDGAEMQHGKIVIQ